MFRKLEAQRERMGTAWLGVVKESDNKVLNHATRRL